MNTNVAFCSVLRSRLGNYPLLFSGEVDCLNPQAPCTQPPSCYVELKTSKEMHSPGQWRSFYRHKLLKWWAQSFLPGVPHVVAGFRNPEGFVCSLKTFPTMEMFENVRVRRGVRVAISPRPVPSPQIQCPFANCLLLLPLPSSASCAPSRMTEKAGTPLCA